MNRERKRNGKRSFGTWLMVLVYSFALCSCTPGTGGLPSSDFLAEEPSKDDSYVCVVDTLLEAGRGEAEADNGRSSEFMGYHRAFRYIYYYMDTYADSYAEMVIADSNGFESSLTWPAEETGYMLGAGHVAGSDEFVTLSFCYPKENEGEYEYTYFLEKRGVDGKVKETVPLDFLSSPEFQEIPKSVAVDGNGCIHMAGAPRMDDRTDYRMLSPSGEILAVKQFDRYSFMRFVTLPDGKIAYDSREYKDFNDGTGQNRQYHHRVEWMDAETGEENLLFEYDELGEQGQVQVQAANVFDDQKLIYANAEGVFLCDYSFANPERIYTWSLHGFGNPSLYEISVDESGAISIFMKRNGGLHFCILVPAPEEVHEIELATLPGNIYGEAVLEFNKRHPEYRIVIKDDYDKTALLTRLMAGDGPVLIDSGLVPFAEQKKLWEPLGKTYEELGILDKFNSAALHLASIDGELYGIVSDFYLQTLLTEADATDWDYDAFIECIENGSNLQYLMDNELGEGKTWVAISVLGRSVEDSYYVDAESGELYFDTEEFRNVLKLINQYVPDQTPVPYMEGLKEGEVLCNHFYIHKPKDLIFYRSTYGDDTNIVGFPGKSGAKHLLKSSNILAIRKTASDQDKEVAKEFAKMLLSHDMQLKMTKDDNFNLSARTDVLEEQINAVKKGEWVSGVSPLGSYKGFYVEEPDNEKNGRELKELIEKSEPYYGDGNDYLNILEEEFSEYFSGRITEDMLIDHLNNRVGIYLKEKR